MEPRQTTLVRLALLQTEVTESLQELLDPLLSILKLLEIHRSIALATQQVKRHGLPGATSALGRELADIVIRTADLAACVGVDLDACVTAVMTANASRPYKYGTPQEDATHE